MKISVFALKKPTHLPVGITVANARRMKDNSFDRAMSQIVNQAHAEQARELQNQRRQLLYGKVRGAFLLLLGAALLVTGFCYREQLQGYVTAKLNVKTAKAGQANGSNSETPQGAASGTISKAADNAAKRDAIIDEVAGGK